MKALNKDILREVKKSGLRFFYICSIIALGVAFFCGIKATSPSMIQTAYNYFSQNTLSDFRLVSTYGLRDKDIKTLENVDGVEQAIGGYSTDQIFKIQDEKCVIKVLSIPSQTGQNQPVLTDGRFPINMSECVVEDSSNHIPGVALNETISVVNDNEGSETHLKTNEYTIVGFVQTPQFVSIEHGNTNIGDGSIDSYIMVKPEAFDYERFTEAYVYTDISAQNTEPYSDEYSKAQEQMISTLEKTGDDILNDNINDIKKDALAEIDKAQAELDKNRRDFESQIAAAQNELNSGQAQVDDGYRQYYQGVDTYNTEIAKAEDELRRGQEQLNEGYRNYQNGREQLEDGLRQGENQLQNGRNQLQDGFDQYYAGVNEFNAQMADGYRELENSRQQVNQGYESYYQGLNEFNAKIEEGQAQLDAAKEDFNKGYDEYVQQLNYFNEQIENGQRQIDDGYLQYEEGIKALSAQKQEFETSIEAAKEQLDEEAKALESQEELYTENKEQYDKDLASYEEQVKDMLPDEIPSELQELKKELDQKEQELTSMREQLDEDTKQLEQGRLQLEEQEKQGLEELNKAQIQLDESKLKLDTSQAQLDQQRLEGEKQLEPASQQLQQAQAQIDSGQTELNNQKAAGEAQLNGVLAQLQSAQQQIEDGARQLEEGRRQAEAELNSSYIQLVNAQDELIRGQDELDNSRIQGERELNAGYQELVSGQRELDNGRIELNNQRIAGQNQLADSLNQLVDSQNKINQGKSELEQRKLDAQRQLGSAQVQIDDNRKKLDDLDKGEWFVYSRDDNPGYTGYKQDTERIDKVGDVFPLFFFLVAALVAFTTMTRMVEEERTQIGTLYALGYSRWNILRKFIVYSGSAALLGATVGWILGILVLPQMIFTAYGILYNIPDFSLNIPWNIIILSYVISLFCTVGAAVIIALAELKNVPAELMRPKAPKPGKRILLERIPFIWNRLNFITKVSARNIFRYKARFFMTVIGIAGCTALILAGFGLHDAIFAIIPNQFGTVFKYDQSLILSDDAKTDKAIEKVIKDERVSGGLLVDQETITVSTDDGSLSAYLIVPEKTDDLKEFVDLHERGKSSVNLPLNDSGIIVSEKLATNYGATPGSTIKLNISGKLVQAKVTAQTENYLENYVYMTPTYYKNLTGNKPDYSVIFVNFSETAQGQEAQEQFATDMIADNNFTSAVTTSSIIDSSTKMLNSLNIIVIVMIVSALILAFIVLNNLTNINISERTREIATLKVLGFRNRETNNYIFRENIILSIFGIIIGLFLGVILLRYIIYTVELDIIMFGRKIETMSYVYAAVLTLLFTLIVNITMIPTLNRVNMVESMKDIE